MEYVQGQPAQRFSVRDIPLIRSATKRWDCIDSAVKSEVGALIKNTLRSPDAALKDKLAAASLAERIDRLNLNDEIFRTPKMDMDLSGLSDDQIQQMIDNLRQMKVLEYDMPFLMKVTEAELLEDTQPMLECEVLDIRVKPLEEYVPRNNTYQGDENRNYLKRNPR